MSAALQAFMTGLVDYAGLFPPAKLTMPAAVDQYARHLDENASWMLGRFIVPAGRLDEFEAAAAGFVRAAQPWRLSVLLGDRQDPEKTLASLPDLAGRVMAFEQDQAGAVAVEVFEIPLPADLDPAEVAVFVTRVGAGLDSVGLSGREQYWEIPPTAPPEAEAALLDGLRDAAKELAADSVAGGRLGLKLRCGGVTPEAFPSVERVARILAGARDRGLPFKGTAGLHHPLRFQATKPAVMMHGFFNVFGAALLAHSRGWDAERLVPVVAETDPSAFRFSAGEFSWRGESVTTADVQRLRRDLLSGFGSCSFAEPREDLQKLGHLA
ncbi:MAG: hypothetical protein CSA62_06160 [Planctomycetota bacterium]|nr:MAG: hypothetical protein CSA62_06160 [Planctomycetota bacterium]